MKKYIVDLLKGIAIGIAYIVAGLSGATIAVICNVYEELLDACSSIVKTPFKTFKKSGKLLIGILLGLILGVLVVEKVFSLAPLPISMLFSGIVIAGIVPLYNKVRNDKKTFKNCVIFCLTFLLVLALPFLFKGDDKVLTVTLSTALILFSLGFITSSALVIPGVSGSIILACVGYFEPILSVLTNLFEEAVTFRFNNFGSNLLIIIFFATGICLGIVFISRLVKKLINRFNSQMNFAILGLVSASSISLIIAVMQNKNQRETINTVMWIAGGICIVVGLVLGHIFCKMENRGSSVDFVTEANKYRDSFINDTISLLKFETVLKEYKPDSDSPFGIENKLALEFLLDKGKEEGFIVKNVDNYAGHIEYGSGEELLGVLGHLDVVPASGNWNTKPFDPVIKDNRIYARGAVDDKGPVMATYYALKIIKDLKLPVSKRIRLIVGCDEESGNRCMKHYFNKEEVPSIGFSPDANYPLIYGEKAFYNFDITGTLNKKSSIIKFKSGSRRNIVPDEACMKINKDLKNEYLKYLKERNYKGEIKDDLYYAYGKSCHGMSPQDGLNASFILMEFLNIYSPCELTDFVCKYLSFDPYGEKLGITTYDDQMGSLSLNCGVLNVIDGKIEIQIDCRVPNNETFDVIQNHVDLATSKYMGLSFNMHDRVPMHYVDPNSFLVRTLVNVYQDITKDKESKPFTIGGGTYAKFIPNAVAFGPMMPNSEDVIHQPNEYLDIDEYIKNIAIYAKSIYELVK